MCLIRAARRLSAGGALAVVMAACQPGGDGPAAALDEATIAARSAHLIAPRPGLYRTTTRLVAFDLPHAARADTAALRHRVARLSPQVRQLCLAPAQARAGFAALARSLGGDNCRFERFDAGRTRLHARLACSGGAGARQAIEMRGRAGAERSRLLVNIEQRNRAIPGGVQRLQLQIDNRRLGACPPGRAAAGNAVPDNPFINGT